MFTGYYLPTSGGIETSVVNLRKGLEAAGHEVFIFAPKYPGWEDKEKNVFRYKSIYFKYNGAPYFTAVPLLSGILEKVKELKLDVIHAHEPYLLGWDAQRIAKKLGIPMVFTYHIRYEDYCHYTPLIPESVAKKCVRAITIPFCKKCNAIIAPATAIKNYLSDHGVRVPIEIIPSGISVALYAKDSGSRESIRAKYKISPDDIVLITASRITKEKNIGFLIEAFAVIRKTDKNAKLLIAGDGVEKPRLERMVKNLHLENDVIFTGLASKEQIMDLYDASDIFVFASLTETQGLVVAEAMASGLPAVTIKASGVEDMIQSGVNGILTENSLDDFTKSVLKVINDNDLRKKMAAQAQIDSKNFSIEIWIEKIVKFYQKLA